MQNNNKYILWTKTKHNQVWVLEWAEYFPSIYVFFFFPVFSFWPFCLSLYPLLFLLLSSLRPPSAVSDHWWISCVTSPARCSRERGTTPQGWLPPPRTDGHPKTSTPPSCRAKTTAVSDESFVLKRQNLEIHYTHSSGWKNTNRCCHIQVKWTFEPSRLVMSPVTWMVIIAAQFNLSISNTHHTSGGIHLLWLQK